MIVLPSGSRMPNITGKNKQFTPSKRGNILENISVMKRKKDFVFCFFLFVSAEDI